MGRELKSCTGVLLRADLTGHSHPTLFGRNWPIGGIGHALLGQPSKRTPVQDFNSFSIMFYYNISTTYQKIGDLFFPVHICGHSHIVNISICQTQVLKTTVCHDGPWTFTQWMPNLLSHLFTNSSDTSNSMNYVITILRFFLQRKTFKNCCFEFTRYFTRI